jgi:rhodanese-related sulfurtransferase
MAKFERGGSKPPNTTRPSRGSRAAPTRPAPTITTGTARVPRWGIVVAAVAAVLLGLGGALTLAFGGSGSGANARPAVSAIAGVPAADITPQEAAARWEAGALLLDVREDEEWSAGHVPGATHIRLDQLASRMAELPTNQTILVICRSGNRSREGRDILRSGGLDRATSVDGGVKAWREAGLPFTGEIV